MTEITLETVVLGGVAAVVAYAGWTFRRMAETVTMLADRMTALESEHKMMMQYGCLHARKGDPPGYDPTHDRCGGGRRGADG